MHLFLLRLPSFKGTAIHPPFLLQTCDEYRSKSSCFSWDLIFLTSNLKDQSKTFIKSVQHCHNDLLKMEYGTLNIKKHLSHEVREHSLLLFTWWLEMFFRSFTRLGKCKYCLDILKYERAVCLLSRQPFISLPKYTIVFWVLRETSPGTIKNAVPRTKDFNLSSL